MGRASIKKNKTEYQKARENLGLTREEAVNLIGKININETRLFKIECTPGTLIRPDEVVTMAKAYKCPALKNYYCTHDCAIGEDEKLNEIKSEDLPSIVLKMIDTLNILENERTKLVSICADGKIAEDEQGEFQRIKAELDSMEKSIETLSLWAKEMELKNNK